MSSILQPIVDRLRSIPSKQWEDVALAAGCAKTLPRKLATGDRSNPGVQTIQPLVDLFARIDRGEISLETLKPAKPARKAKPTQEVSHG